MYSSLLSSTLANSAHWTQAGCAILSHTVHNEEFYRVVQFYKSLIDGLEGSPVCFEQHTAYNHFGIIPAQKWHMVLELSFFLLGRGKTEDGER